MYQSLFFNSQFCEILSEGSFISLSIYCNIFAAMILLDSSLKIITQDGRIIKHPKDFPTGNIPLSYLG